MRTKNSQSFTDSLRPAIFLDRDGTLMEDVDYCNRPEDVRIFPQTTPSLLQLSQAGFLLVLITNQSGIGRQIITPEEYQAVHQEFLRQIAPATLDGHYFCPSLPDAQDTRRKPAPGMVLEAANDLPIDLPRSWFIGDKEIDVQCGHNARIRSILVRTGYGETHHLAKQSIADFVANSIAEATTHILESL